MSRERNGVEFCDVVRVVFQPEGEFARLGFRDALSDKPIPGEEDVNFGFHSRAFCKSAGGIQREPEGGSLKWRRRVTTRHSRQHQSRGIMRFDVFVRQLKELRGASWTSHQQNVDLYPTDRGLEVTGRPSVNKM